MGPARGVRGLAARMGRGPGCACGERRPGGVRGARGPGGVCEADVGRLYASCANARSQAW